jgi:hypothetical protein
MARRDSIDAIRYDLHTRIYIHTHSRGLSFSLKKAAQIVPWVQDACRALRELSLLYDAADWDCHLQHHFAILLGKDQPCRVSRQPVMPFLRH